MSDYNDDEDNNGGYKHPIGTTFKKWFDGWGLCEARVVDRGEHPDNKLTTYRVHYKLMALTKSSLRRRLTVIFNNKAVAKTRRRKEKLIITSNQ